MRRYLLLSLVTFITAVFNFGFINNEEDPLKNLLTKLQTYKDKNPQEKVHIHTDKPYYSIGDSIWFKAYIVNDEQNQLSGISKILYVDLINEKDSVKKSLRVPVISGLAWGDFVLADSLTEGNYRLRAYTTWMRNYGEEYYFDKTIQIGNALSNQLVGNVNYTFSKTGIKENVAADITYQDINGNPIANKEVTYTVQLDSRNVANGKVITDANGKSKITFTNAQPFVLKSGKLNTTVKLDAKQFVRKSFPVKATSAEVDVQFFPESGQLVNDLPSKVGFKAIGADGLSRDISGYITDNQNNRLAEFSSEHAGMGVFILKPSKDNTYKAVVTFKDGSQKQIDLPKAVDEGYVLAVSNSDSESLNIRITTSAGLAEKGEFTLVAHTNGVVNYVSKANIANRVFMSKLSKKRFPAGIVTFTLFSPNYQPVAERLVFIHQKSVSLDVKTEKPVYGKREKVTLNFSTQDTAAKVTRGNYSIAVVNESVVPYDDGKETTILSNLLLTSDLKGYIENPNYYFTDVNALKNQHLDILLLTQGWRRFSWINIINNTYPNTVYKPEKSISVSGRITNAAEKPVAGATVTLLPTKGNSTIMDTVTNAEGRFSFDNLNFNDSTTFVVKGRSPSGKKNIYIEIDRLPTQLVTRNKNAAAVEVNVNQSLFDYLKTRRQDFTLMYKTGILRKSIMLDEVKVAQKKPVITNSSNLNGAGNADAIIKADQLQHCQNLAFCLQGMIAGVVVQNGIAYSMRSMYSSFSGMVPMQIIIDGMYVEPEYLSVIMPADVESIEVLKSISNTTIYGIRGTGGVLVINTKRGERNLSYKSMSPGLASYKPQGLFTQRQFYSPVYDRQPKTESILPDLRNTVYWSPNIITDANGKASVSFYTADIAGTHKVVVEGLGFNGSLVRTVYRFSVQ